MTILCIYPGVEIVVRKHVIMKYPATSVCRIDLEVVYMSSHFPFSKSDLSGSFVGLTASSLRDICW